MNMKQYQESISIEANFTYVCFFQRNACNTQKVTEY